MTTGSKMLEGFHVDYDRFMMPERPAELYRYKKLLNFFLREGEKCYVINYNKLVNIPGHAPRVIGQSG